MSKTADWLRERSLWQVLGVYLAGSWVAFEVVATVSDTLDLPGWVARGILVLIAVGIPILVTAVLLRRREGLFTLRNALVAGALAFATLFAIGGLVVALRDAPDVAAPEPSSADPSIAVLPAYSPGEATTIGATMNTLLSAGIDGAAGWRAVSPRTVQARWSERVPSGIADEATSLEVGRATGARYAVLPIAVVLPNAVQLSAEVFDLSDLSRVAVVEQTGPPDSLASVAGGLSVQILNQVLRGEGDVTVDLAQVTTGSPEALLAFLEGEAHFRDYELVDARNAFLRAVAIDSAFALAHYRLAEVYQWGEAWEPEASDRHMRLAAGYAERLGPREAAVARAQTATGPGSDAKEAARRLREVAAAYPDDPMVWYWLGETLIHGVGALARTSEIDSVFQRAVQLDPDNPALYPHTLHLTYTYRRDPELARAHAERFARVSGDVAGPFTVDVDPRAAIPAWDLAFGDSAARRRAESWVLDSERPRGRALAILGHLRSPAFEREVSWLLPILGDSGSPAPEARFAQLEHGDQLAPHYRLQRDLVWKGKVARAVEVLPALPDRAGTGISLLLAAHVAGTRLPDSVLEAEFGARRIDPDMSFHRALGTVILAKEEGREADVARGLEALASRFESADDPPEWWLALQGVLAWKDGEIDRAVDLLDTNFYVERPFHWAYVRLLLEQERWTEVEPLLATGAWDTSYAGFSEAPIARYYLGRVYEELGRAEEARAAYGYFVENWADADEAAQGMVADARSRLQELLRETG